MSRNRILVFEKILYFCRIIRLKFRFVISLENRKMLLKTCMYGCETWIIGMVERKRLEDFEMSCYRRIFNIK